MFNNDIPLIGPILNRIIGSRNDRFVKRYTNQVNRINALEPTLRAMSDEQIAARIDEFRERFAKGETEEQLIPEAFATAREAMDRSVGIRNVFNPQQKFDPNTLPTSELRLMYAKLKMQMDQTPPAEPTGEWLGNAQPIAGWQQVSIPPEFYEGIRGMYPESRPPYRARPFDVQLIGAMVLAQGKISEMRTGEGKTIVGPLATYLAAIRRMKVHVVTVNDYLVQRDRDWTFPFFHGLGLTVGAIHPQHMQSEDVKRQMYKCDVVYGTTSEFGFDYLRDNMKQSADQQVQRRRDFAIVDEVDSILIDEARTPLIISGPAHQGRPRYELADRLARHLVSMQRPWQEAEDAHEAVKLRIKGLEGDIRTVADRATVPALTNELKELKAKLPQLHAERAKHTQFYELQMDRKSCHLTHEGIAEAQRQAGVGSFYVGENIDIPHLLEQSLRAHAVYTRDKDYIVAPSEDPETGQMVPSIVIVDVNTGRPMVGRQWSDGLHQAVEAKEQVPIKKETQTVATITVQNFFKMYKRLAGMTGTADTEAQEFHDIYKLDVVSIPTNKPVVRKDHDDVVFLRQKDKWIAIVDEIKNMHDAGRPVLVGTTSVEKSEMLSGMLTQRHGVKHEVLNAKQHEREAHIVEAAGQLGAVMIATNMAGRGTDIKLGAISRQALLDHWLRRGLAPREANVNMSDEEIKQAIYRKIAVSELEITKEEAAGMNPTDLEMRLLQAWCARYTLLSDGAIKKLPAEKLREELDFSGKVILHRIRWFETIEQLGGLHVIGTERHESRRIDNQLRGRAGRQGDNGSSRFYISLEDDLMKFFGGETTQRLLARMGMREGMPIESGFLSKRLEAAQRKVEERNFQYRKQILEYDEVMEHQRQRFYGMRQRALEGRDLRGMIFDFIGANTQEAASSFLHDSYSSIVVAEYVNSRLDGNIPAARLRKIQPEDLVARVREETLAETRNIVSVTLGEYLPDAARDEGGLDANGKPLPSAVDLDRPGLIRWAKERFGVELTEADIPDSSRQTRLALEDRLLKAAEARIEQTDLSEVSSYLSPDFGRSELAKWVKHKFGIDVSVDEIKEAQANGGGAEKVTAMIVKRVEAEYLKREIEYPVNFRMQLTMGWMRQNPQYALGELCRWANGRYGLKWTPEAVMKMPPTETFKVLREESEKFVTGGKLEIAIQEAMKTKGDTELDQHLKDKYGEGMPDSMKNLPLEEREDAIRARVENILRQEQVMFERMVLLQTFDNIWREHLYSMDQLRDSIGYRTISQQDPRIEYKREGSRMFNEMMETIRERLTDVILRAELTPQVAPAPMARPVSPMGGPVGAPMGGGGSAAGGSPFGSRIGGLGV